jgi:ATP-dependent DNA helicase RecG
MYLKRAFAEDVLAANNRTYEERLASLKMIVSPDDTTPTVTGMLMLGKKPDNFIYGGYIQWLRISGTKLGDPVLDEKEARGNVYEMIKMIEDRLDAYNRHAVNISPETGHSIIVDDYPDYALKQILHNAVLHRLYEGTNAPVHVYMYDDRVEIQSPGGPVGVVTPENFGQPGLIEYRNQNLAMAMKDMKIIQRFGQGISTAQDAMARNGNPPIKFEVDNYFVKATLYKCEGK